MRNLLAKPRSSAELIRTLRASAPLRLDWQPAPSMIGCSPPVARQQSQACSTQLEVAPQPPETPCWRAKSARTTASPLGNFAPWSSCALCSLVTTGSIGKVASLVVVRNGQLLFVDVVREQLKRIDFGADGYATLLRVSRLSQRRCLRSNACFRSSYLRTLRSWRGRFDLTFPEW